MVKKGTKKFWDPITSYFVILISVAFIVTIIAFILEDRAGNFLIVVTFVYLFTTIVCSIFLVNIQNDGSQKVFNQNSEILEEIKAQNSILTDIYENLKEKKEDKNKTEEERNVTEIKTS